MGNWPDIDRSHRPDMAVLLEDLPAERRDANHTKEYMWPSINLEDLTQSSMPLLWFLTSRVRNLPDAFAHADWEAMRVGTACGAIPFAFLRTHTMLLEG